MPVVIVLYTSSTAVVYWRRNMYPVRWILRVAFFLETKAHRYCISFTGASFYLIIERDDLSLS